MCKVKEYLKCDPHSQVTEEYQATLNVTRAVNVQEKMCGRFVSGVCRNVRGAIMMY